jgi:hypothetical protein
MALGYTMLLHPVRISTHFQRISLVPRLATALTLAGLAQTAISGRFLEPIAGRRLAAVAAVLGYLIF